MTVLEGQEFAKNLNWRLDPRRTIAGSTAMQHADGPRVHVEVQLGRNATIEQIWCLAESHGSQLSKTLHLTTGAGA